MRVFNVSILWWIAAVIAVIAVAFIFGKHTSTATPDMGNLGSTS
jgi:hypothetical protein